ncbi:hypothetical protein N7E81_16595 [Reichenbachiella carrageenanivorans]|uniref:MetA-pathway of phenol degradation n=1 Tax=Reichenbachiella carrageenanivorans TaxID=2979869 RepID=A0ABY6CYI0_9BACT|nr:hypothetical protein [Reichenbachiella carrageenanivorans]UXX78974.1 hypothetical protein N7E81_16595 [Reichenbachiella carrageenanivorans]
MMKLHKMAILALVLISGTQAAEAGGGWVHAKGKGYFKISQWWVVADQHYTSTGGVDPNVTMGTFNTSIYGEYGISDRLNAQIYFPFFSRSFNNEVVSKGTGEVTIKGDAVNSIGDTNIGVKYGLIVDKPIVLSAHIWLGLPLGKSDYDRNDDNVVPLLTGDGEFNQIVGLTASTAKTFGGVNVFASLGAEFNNRTNGYSDEIRVNFELGAVLKEKLILVYKLRWLNSLRNGDSNFEDGASLFSNNAEYVGYTYEIAYNLTDKIGLSANYGAVYSAKLIFASPSYEVGVYLNL